VDAVDGATVTAYHATKLEAGARSAMKALSNRAAQVLAVRFAYPLAGFAGAFARTTASTFS
jgi:hypothetical protein